MNEKKFLKIIFNAFVMNLMKKKSEKNSLPIRDQILF